MPARTEQASVIAHLLKQLFSVHFQHDCLPFTHTGESCAPISRKWIRTPATTFSAITLAWLFGIAGSGLMVSPQAWAQLSGGDFEIRRSTIDAGGDTSTGGEFVLSGTIGQPDTDQSSAGAFELNAGFWTPASSDLIFKDSYEG